MIWLLARGRSCAETAALTGFARRWVEQLLARYNAFGPSSLGDRRCGNGAKPTLLTPEMLAKLRERLKTRRWRGLDREEGGGRHGGRARACQGAEQRGWEALQAIGWTIQRPRPRHVRAATPRRRWRVQGAPDRLWHDLSDVKLADALDDRASFRRFCGFSRFEPTPERTAFVRFRRLSSRGSSTGFSSTASTKSFAPAP